jgi:hypothetical protein
LPDGVSGPVLESKRELMQIADVLIDSIEPSEPDEPPVLF